MHVFLCYQLNISLHDRRQLSGLESSEFDQYEFYRSVVFLSDPSNPVHSYFSVEDLSQPLSSFWKNQWSDEEVRNATGYSNVMVAKHPLKLCSSYARLKVLVCAINLDHS